MVKKRQTRTILLLIADTGAGHRSAANALSQELYRLQANRARDYYRIELIDVFSTCARLPIRKLGALYAFAIRYAPWLYGAFFHLTNHRRTFQALEWLLHRLIHRGLAQLFADTDPDVIVSLHPLLNHVSLDVLTELQMDVPVITVVTDLVTPHRGWAAPGVDACIVPTELAGKFCQEQGMPAKRISVLGLPIDVKFSQPVLPKSIVCQQLDFESTLPIVLLMGGGGGAGGLERLVHSLWQADLPIQLLVITGHHVQLQRRLTQFHRQLPVHLQKRCRILGFVEQMPEFMQAADMLITKAGPSTICEAITCSLPLVLTSWVPGQEKGNVDYVCKQGIGVYAKTPEDLIKLVGECFQQDSVLREHMQANMSRLQNPCAAQNIAECILQHLAVNETSSSALA
jgi:1,2-diacylglycerol 3-beta-galactosyltransferase